MKHDITFGALVLQDMPWQELVRLWKKFDDIGFDNTWVGSGCRPFC
ncbi:MAG: hypothetical protein P1Q69_09975 [Candidatus Thorarchaeota archaeon]|nr:hypothetical protein [Candidatus Thorarchaeota archaeon]